MEKKSDPASDTVTRVSPAVMKDVHEREATERRALVEQVGHGITRLAPDADRSCPPSSCHGASLRPGCRSPTATTMIRAQIAEDL